MDRPEESKRRGGARPASSHKPDCGCPACSYRRRGQDGETPQRHVRLSDEVWDWLLSQPGGAAKYIESHVREQMLTEKTTKTLYGVIERALERKVEAERNGLNPHLTAIEEAELKEHAIRTMLDHDPRTSGKIKEFEQKRHGV